MTFSITRRGPHKSGEPHQTTLLPAAPAVKFSPARQSPLCSPTSCLASSSQLCSLRTIGRREQNTLSTTESSRKQENIKQVKMFILLKLQRKRPIYLVLGYRSASSGHWTSTWSAKGRASLGVGGQVRRSGGQEAGEQKLTIWLEAEISRPK